MFASYIQLVVVSGTYFRVMLDGEQHEMEQAFHRSINSIETTSLVPAYVGSVMNPIAFPEYSE